MRASIEAVPFHFEAEVLESEKAIHDIDDRVA